MKRIRLVSLFLLVVAAGCLGIAIPGEESTDGGADMGFSSKPFSRRGALVYKSAGQTIPNAATTTVTWENEFMDTDNIHDPVTNNSRLTVPPGVTQVKILAQIRMALVGTGIVETKIYKNGGTFLGTPVVDKANNGLWANTLQGSTMILDVNPGDYFELVIYQNAGSPQSTYFDYSTWFAMEIYK